MPLIAKPAATQTTAQSLGALLKSARDTEAKFARTLDNLFRLYRALLDTLHFFDNSSDTPRLIFKEEAGQATIQDATLYEQLRGQFAP